MKRVLHFAVSVSISLGAGGAVAQSSEGRAFDIAVERAFCGDRGVKSAEFEDGSNRRILVVCEESTCFDTRVIDASGVSQAAAYKNAVAALACDGDPVRLAKVRNGSEIEVLCGTGTACGGIGPGVAAIGGLALLGLVAGSGGGGSGGSTSSTGPSSDR